MHSIKKNWQLIGVVVVALVLATVVGLGYTLRSQAAETKVETAAFFTVPVHVVLPEAEYVKSYQLQTNELVSLRSVLTFNNIAIFSGEEIFKINAHDSNHETLSSFEATPEAPIYVRVIAKEKQVLDAYQNLIQPTQALTAQYLATPGIEIIIEQPYYHEASGEQRFLTAEELQASIQTQTVQLSEVSGYYDEYGNWIEGESSMETENEIVPEEICGADQTLVDGICQFIEDTWEPTEEPSEQPLTDDETTAVAPSCDATETLVAGVCQPQPPVCATDEILVDNQCQPQLEPEPTPPTCNENEELVGDQCQVKPESEDDGDN